MKTKQGLAKELDKIFFIKMSGGKGKLNRMFVFLNQVPPISGVAKELEDIAYEHKKTKQQITRY